MSTNIQPSVFPFLRSSALSWSTSVSSGEEEYRATSWFSTSSISSSATQVSEFSEVDSPPESPACGPDGHTVHNGTAALHFPKQTFVLRDPPHVYPRSTAPIRQGWTDLDGGYESEAEGPVSPASITKPHGARRYTFAHSTFRSSGHGEAHLVMPLPPPKAYTTKAKRRHSILAHHFLSRAPSTDSSSSDAPSPSRPKPAASHQPRSIDLSGLRPQVFRKDERLGVAISSDLEENFQSSSTEVASSPEEYDAVISKPEAVKVGSESSQKDHFEGWTPTTSALAGSDCGLRTPTPTEVIFAPPSPPHEKMLHPISLPSTPSSSNSEDASYFFNTFKATARLPVANQTLLSLRNGRLSLNPQTPSSPPIPPSLAGSTSRHGLATLTPIGSSTPERLRSVSSSPNSDDHYPQTIAGTPNLKSPLNFPSPRRSPSAMCSTTLRRALLASHCTSSPLSVALALMHEQRSPLTLKQRPNSLGLMFNAPNNEAESRGESGTRPDLAFTREDQNEKRPDPLDVMSKDAIDRVSQDLISRSSNFNPYFSLDCVFEG